MKTKHTPGPYSISGIAGDNHVMALPSLHQPCAKVTVAIVPGWPGISLEEHEANKRLFRAAPDLLAALKAFDDAFSHYCEGDPSEDEVSALLQARAALAQAQGKE